MTARNDKVKPSVVIKPGKGLLQLDLAAIWEYREMLYFLIWRDVVVRYKQTAIGATWVVIQPMITMLIFTIIFSRLANIPSDGLPYPLFAFTALLPWSYFSQALSRCSNSVVGNSHLITKIYFPRILIPLSATIAPIIDLFFTFLVLLLMMLFYRIVPSWPILALPAFLVLSIVSALAIGLWSAALNVRYRDVGYIVPFLLQVWMYASPIAYPISIIPAKWQKIYCLNPIVGVIEGFRWALLGKQAPPLAMFASSTAVVIVMMFLGLIYFKHVERTFADII